MQLVFLRILQCIPRWEVRIYYNYYFFKWVHVDNNKRKNMQFILITQNDFNSASSGKRALNNKKKKVNKFADGRR